jgi:hypothetical protein
VIAISEMSHVEANGTARGSDHARDSPRLGGCHSGLADRCQTCGGLCSRSAGSRRRSCLRRIFTIFNELPDPDADPRASSRILEHEPDGIALGLLEAQAVWISTQDRVRLRRALLGVLARLDD